LLRASASRWTRAIDAADDGLKLLSLGRGASGVRWAVIALIEAMLAAA
jgi:histidine ammonia-lyase